VGQLQRARRWDYVSTIPATEATYPAVPAAAPAQDLNFAYSLGKRVRKTSAVSAQNTLEVFDTLRLSGSFYRNGDYDNEAVNVTGYLAGGMARVEHMSAAPSPSNNPVHMLLQIGDHLGSTGVVVDWETAELVEKATYMPYGAIESDYRPTRWKSFREEYKFTGKEEDIEVGLTYFGARYYHARLGRFISPDPLTVHMAAADPNPYAYVRGRTMSHVDPFGLREALAAPPSDSSDTQNHGEWGWSATVDGYLELGMNASPHQGMLEGGLAKLSMAAERAWQDGNRRFGSDGFHIVPTHVAAHTANLGVSMGTDVAAVLALVSGSGPLAAAIHSSAPQVPVASEPGDVSVLIPVAASLLIPGGGGGGAATGVTKAARAAEGAKAYSVAAEVAIPEVGAGTRALHAKAANAALAESMAPEAMEALGIKIPRSSAGSILGESPKGWSWHHVPDQPGVLQLVPRAMHQGSAWQPLLHPGGVGGFKIWGARF
jgi:RHS repeat-associated protein